MSVRRKESCRERRPAAVGEGSKRDFFLRERKWSRLDNGLDKKKIR